MWKRNLEFPKGTRDGLRHLLVGVNLVTVFD